MVLLKRISVLEKIDIERAAYIAALETRIAVAEGKNIEQARTIADQAYVIKEKEKQLADLKHLAKNNTSFAWKTVVRQRPSLLPPS